MIPVIIQDLIDKVTDKGLHPEKRQHYADTLKRIVESANKALNQFDKDWKSR